MSRILINRYLAELDRTKRFSGSLTEEVIREAFKGLLRDASRDRNLFLQVEYTLQGPQKNTIKLDGAVLHELRVPLGYWEAKDTADVLDREIDKKLRKGYPQDNILFEDSATAVLIQNRIEVMRCAMTDVDALDRLLHLFFAYERPEIAEFRKAVAQFSTDLPAILDGLRAAIATAYRDNTAFAEQAAKFLDHAKGTINPTLTEEDVREMLIQHILTEEIFTQVFNDGQYHRENNIARELSRLEDAFFTGSVRRNVLDVLKTYYASIKSNAALITSHAEKQKFLKLIYEGFYKVYNPKAADRLGVVYTPNEIVRFMIEGADWLCHTCFRGQPQALHRKYNEDLHANEMAILQCDERQLLSSPYLLTLPQNMVRRVKPALVRPRPDQVVKWCFSRVTDQTRRGNVRKYLFQPPDVEIKQAFADPTVLGCDFVPEEISITSICECTPLFSSKASVQLVAPSFGHVSRPSDKPVDRHRDGEVDHYFHSASFGQRLYGRPFKMCAIRVKEGYPANVPCL